MHSRTLARNMKLINILAISPLFPLKDTNTNKPNGVVNVRLFVFFNVLINAFYWLKESTPAADQ